LITATAEGFTLVKYYYDYDYDFYYYFVLSFFFMSLTRSTHASDEMIYDLRDCKSSEMFNIAKCLGRYKVIKSVIYYVAKEWFLIVVFSVIVHKPLGIRLWLFRQGKI
jgi:hypothetical protein